MPFRKYSSIHSVTSKPSHGMNAAVDIDYKHYIAYSIHVAEIGLLVDTMFIGSNLKNSRRLR